MVGQYGQEWMDALRATSPEEYARLKETGELLAAAMVMDEMGRTAYARYLESLMGREPLPPATQFWERAGAIRNLQFRARELARAEIMPPDPTLSAG